MQNRIIEWFQEDQFASANLNRVELFETKGRRSLSLRSSFELPSQVSCISCCAPRGIVAVGQQSGNVSFIDSDTSTGVVIYDSSAARRPCTAVAWNKLNSTHLAAGFEKSRSQGEFCAVVWDVESGSGTAGRVLFRPVSEEPTASICWLDAHVLVVGTSISWVRLYDVRISAAQQGPGQGGEIMSIMAHAATRPRKVKGIRCDHLQQHVVATFSDSPGEPIKVWDLRKAGASAKPKLMIVQSQVAAVVDVVWSAARAGVLAVATNQSRNVNFYSTVRPVTELISRTPFHTITVSDPVKSLSWKMGSGSGPIGGPGGAMGQSLTFEPSSSNEYKEYREREKESLRSNRLLVATTAGFADLDVIESVGLGQGAGGLVAVGAGRHVHVMSSSTLDSSSDMEVLMAARCTAGYSIDAGKNLQVLSDEMDALLTARDKERSLSVSLPSTVHLERSTSSADLLSGVSGGLPIEKSSSSSSLPDTSDTTSQRETEDTLADSGMPAASRMPSQHTQLMALSRLWAWVDRVESLSVSFGGVINLLISASQATNSTVHSELGVQVYFSGSRDLAKQLCGWTRMQTEGTAQPPSHSNPAVKGKEGKEGKEGREGRLSEKSKSRAASSDYSHDSNLSGGRSQGSGDDEPHRDDMSEQSRKGQGGGGGRGRRSEKERSEKDSLCSSSEGFDPLSELEEMVAECEAADCFERAASIALFQGDLTLAVGVLQRHIPLSAAANRERGERGDGDHHLPSVTAGNKRALQNNANADADNSEGEGADTAAYHCAPATQSEGSKSDVQYTQLISLTAMCIAGFSNNSSASSSSSALSLSPHQEMWASMCRHVVTQLELQADSAGHNNTSCCYLAAALRFLLDTLYRNKSIANPTRKNSEGAGDMQYSCVVNDDRLSLEDRVSFALTYLDDRQTLEWLRGIKDDCTLRGDLGGLVVTGLAEEGLCLLQQYLDRHDDLQTVALLVGRNVIDNATPDAASPSPASGGAGSSQVKSREWQWLWEYRDLLNKMQLFMGRASLDVQLGRRNRLLVKPCFTAAASASRPVSTGSTPYGSNKLRSPQPPGGVVAGRGSGAIDRKSGSARVLYQLPPHSDLTHVFLRCNYCSSSLPVDPMQQQQAAFFRKQRPVINCCANCKKPLPRCYVCLLYMGLVNPTHEFNRALVQKRKASAELTLLATQCNTGGKIGGSDASPFTGTSGQANPPSNPSNPHNGPHSGPQSSHTGQSNQSEETPHNVLAFGQWFFFCQHCKHGGHAACIDDWFEGEDKDRGDRGGVRGGSGASGGSGGAGGREVCGVNGCFCHCRSLK